MKTRRALVAVALTIFVSGCGASPSATTVELPSASPASPTANIPAQPTVLPNFGHVHGIVPVANSADVLLGSHRGVYRISTSGEVTGPLGGQDFDAMSIASNGDTIFVSGHPGANTSPELGSPNLGIISSIDGGNTWVPVAFTGEEDFHVLAVQSDNTLVGIGSTLPNLLIGTAGGQSWQTQPPVPATALAATANQIYAATSKGLLVSNDGGATFAPAQQAPLLVLMSIRPDGTVVGVAADRTIWSQQVDGSWQSWGSISGKPEAIGVNKDGEVFVLDSRGLVQVTAAEVVVISTPG